MLVSIDEERCRELGLYIARLDIPPAQEEEVEHVIPKELLPNFYFNVVAICHQTTPHDGPALRGFILGRERRGWDYLRESWMAAAVEHPEILTPNYLADVSPAEILGILYDKEAGSTITDPFNRAKFLQDIGRKMLEDGENDVTGYYLEARRRLANHRRRNKEREGLISRLSRFRAYGEDPVRKKLFYFLILMKRYCGWKYQDAHLLGPPVDYHEMRGHLRLGTVVVLSKNLEQKIRLHHPLSSREDVALRQAVFDAIMLISKASGRSAEDMHYNFWNIFRNCCRRDETHCAGCFSHPSLPERYATLLKDGKCVFADICASAVLEHEKKPLDPAVKTTFY